MYSQTLTKKAWGLGPLRHLRHLRKPGVQLGLAGLGLGAGTAAWAKRNYTKNRDRAGRTLYASADTGEYSTPFAHDDWKRHGAYKAFSDTIYHPSAAQNTGFKASWEGVPRSERMRQFGLGKPMHRWVDRSQLPKAPVKFDDKLYSRDVLDNLFADDFERMGFSPSEAAKLEQGDYGQNQLNWVLRDGAYRLEY